ncbi:MAG: hypothetical protein MR451_01495, partial [Clostridiales bacterium]|nr:hypothetical protein [Clostridiales bacterium]
GRISSGRQTAQNDRPGRTPGGNPHKNASRSGRSDEHSPKFYIRYLTFDEKKIFYNYIATKTGAALPTRDARHEHTGTKAFRHTGRGVSGAPFFIFLPGLFHAL